MVVIKMSIQDEGSGSIRVGSEIICLTQFKMGLLAAALRWGGRGQKGPLSKNCHAYSTMMKLGTVIPYLKKIQKNI